MDNEHTQTSEAPKSLNIRAYYKGFSVQFTKRNDDEDLTPFVQQAQDLIDDLIVRSWNPSWNEQTNEKVSTVQSTPKLTPQVTTGTQKSVLANASCPIHNVPMLKNKFGLFHKNGEDENGKAIWCKGQPKRDTYGEPF